jgi:hypothetical protein
MTHKLAQLFDNPHIYDSDNLKNILKEKSTAMKRKIIQLGVNYYVYDTLNLLSKNGIIDDKTKPVVYLKEIEDEYFFGDKKIIGLMAKDIAKQESFEGEWKESLFVFFEMLDKDALELFSLEYILYNEEKDCITGRAFRQGDESLLAESMVERIIKLRNEV